MTELAKTRLAESKLGFIGVGSMGGAIIRGLLAGGRVTRENLVYYDPDPARQAQMDELGVEAALDTAEVMHAPVVVLAVKPQVMPAVLAGVKEFARPWHLMISIAAGVPLQVLEAALPESRLIRVMPNAPTLVGAGMAALAPGRGATSEDLALGLELFGAVGQAVIIEERLMDAVTGLSGSGPAFVAVFIEALADGGVKMGLPRPLALTLATQTVLGSARLCLEERLHPALLKDMVTSPGGTTIAGLHALECSGFRGAVMDAVTAAAARSKELGQA
ncbi:MAG: pyrroline-5-carboxylate reductase [Syntrophobacterales bacterium]|jgi:pyrroline-5-carboxylate reductase|nr:pyrroline-5-carboxylate reductase [Syntrophobacterales bacterium]